MTQIGNLRNKKIMPGQPKLTRQLHKVTPREGRKNVDFDGRHPIHTAIIPKGTKSNVTFSACRIDYIRVGRIGNPTYNDSKSDGFPNA